MYGQKQLKYNGFVYVWQKIGFDNVLLFTENLIIKKDDQTWITQMIYVKCNFPERQKMRWAFIGLHGWNVGPMDSSFNCQVANVTLNRRKK